MSINGVVNIYKEKGYTSHDVVAIVRKLLNNVKVGHTGTLDPNACGVLPICIGKATKLSQLLTDKSKGYKVEVLLGFVTDTDDNTGTVLLTRDVNIAKKTIEQVISMFAGRYEQIPPMYSAVKVNGQRLYKLARDGKVIDRNPRIVNIESIKVDNFVSDNKFIMDVKCSKGTYMRTLCKDIGEKLGCGATMGELIRTYSGHFHINNSIKLEDFKKSVENDEHYNVILPISSVLSNYIKVTAIKAADKLLHNGNKIPLNYIVFDDELKLCTNVLVYNYENKLISLSQLVEEDNLKLLRPLVMFI